MKAFVNFAKVGIGDVSVDLGGGNVGVKKEGGEAVAAKIEIIFNAISGGLVDENRAILFTFAAYDKFATFKVDGVAI